MQTARMRERTVFAMRGKVSEAIKTLRSALRVTQLELAIKLDIGGHSVAHYESGRSPDAVTTARLCRIAHEARRDDLADIFAVALPGVAEGLLVPVWWIPKSISMIGKETGHKPGNDPLLHPFRRHVAQKSRKERHAACGPLG